MEKLYIGIDLGTSAVKLLLLKADGTLVKTVSREYPVSYPQPGWSEQNPDDWIDAIRGGMKELVNGIDASAVAGIGTAGQMHGLVILDENNTVIRPAILWNDGRTAEEVTELNDGFGREKLKALTGNIAFAGFTAPKLMWLRKHEPENAARIAKMMLPKDYVNYRLTGVHACDYSDAAGTLWLDVEHKGWSRELLELCAVDETQLPKLFESYQTIGNLTEKAAFELGLTTAVKVCAGAGDNAAAALGMGIHGEGGCNISLGTSGTVFISSKRFLNAPTDGIHSFAHADGGYHLLVCMLSAASCNKWFMEDILGSADYASLQAEIGDEKLGRNHVFFLPYLMGERSPINDTDARSCFIGMTMDNSRADLLQAVLEGVAFALRDSIDLVRESGTVLSASKVCGGGAKSRLWLKILANVLNLPLQLSPSEQGPGIGAAMLAMTACGEYQTPGEASEKLSSVAETVYPDEAVAARYEAKYRQFQKLYPALKPVFKEIH